MNYKTMSKSSSHSDADDSNDNEETSPKKKLKLDRKYKRRTQKYRDDWKKEYGSWIEQSLKGDEWLRCSACGGQELKANSTSIQRHAQRQKQINNIKTVKQTPSIFSLTKEQETLRKKIKENELRLALFLTEHDLPITTSGPLVQLVKTMDPNSRIIQGMSCDRTKCTALIQNAISSEQFEATIVTLRKSKFSIMIDEAIDCSTQKQLVIIARYLNEDTDEVVDCFLTLLQPKSGTHVDIYNAIVEFFQSSDIPYKTNLIGFGSDGANVMMGKKNSVTSLLKQDVPNLFVFKCICHSVALCASQATEKLPNFVESLLKDIYNYLKYSSKRSQKLASVISLLELPNHKILKLCKVRGLSTLECVKRVVELYPALIEFFTEEAKTAADVTSILQNLNNPYTLLYLQFLEFILPPVVNMNKKFQSVAPQIHNLYEDMLGLYRFVLDCYIDHRFLDGTQIQLVDVTNTENFVKLDDIDLGPKVNAEIRKLARTVPPQNIKAFRTYCQNFLMELTSKIKLKFPFGDPEIDVLQYCKFIDVANLQNVRSIAPLADYFNMDVVEVDCEYRLFRTTYKDTTIADSAKFWAKVKRDKKDMFPNVILLYDTICILPHTSASCEREFSYVNANKTKSRNRMKTKMLTGLLRGKSFLRKQKRASHNCTIPLAMINKCNVKYLYDNIEDE